MDGEHRIAELEAALVEKDRVHAAELALRDARVAQLEEQVAKLLELLNRNSSNSNLPPSSDGPGQGAGKKKSKGKRRRGGQKGHRGAHRVLLPAEQVAEFVELFPGECHSCWERLPERPDPLARRYQYTELRPLAAHTTEYRRHAVVCPHCGYRTRAAYDQTIIPASAFGPRLMSVVVLLTGVYHLSRRQTVSLLWELVGVRLSVGSVSRIEQRMSDSVAPAVDEAWEQALSAKVKHADATSWLRAGVLLSLWTVASAAVTVFKVLPDGKGQTLRTKLFVKVFGILVSDRATALKFWAMARRQICWAHLLRKFVSFSERDGPEAAIGDELLEYTKLVFAYWADFREGKLDRARLREWMAPVRVQFEALLRRAVAADIRGLSGSCADILEHRAALWTFIEREGVEPTNNHAERELRAFVLWRRRSFGAQSERGDLFAERLMSVAHTARKQGRNVLQFLTACAQASTHNRATPSLLSVA